MGEEEKKKGRPNKYDCPRCGTPMKRKQVYDAGRTYECPKCKLKITVPK